MQILTDQIEKVFFAYPVEKLCDASKILFIDIETTGFTAKSSNLYLIGCVYFNSGIWYTKQFFAENYSEESEIITEFFEFAKDYTYLIHFNGNNFDLPYITQKCKDLNLPYNFDSFEGLDIYKRVAPYKEVLKIENCKQKTLESFLKIERKDEMGGGDLIGVYHHFVESGDEEARKLLLLHNRDDIAGMLKLLPILSYVDLFNENIHVTKVSANYYKDYTGKDRSELIMSFDCPSIILTPVTIIKGNLYMTASGNQGLIKVPIYEEEMKYFYANYRDYYYLPSEDQALHKSVAMKTTPRLYVTLVESITFCTYLEDDGIYSITFQFIQLVDEVFLHNFSTHSHKLSVYALYPCAAKLSVQMVFFFRCNCR